MYGMEEGGASAGKAKAGLVRCREAYATVILASDGRALIARHRRDDVEKEESERCSCGRRLHARADPEWPEIDTGIIC